MAWRGRTVSGGTGYRGSQLPYFALGTLWVALGGWLAAQMAWDIGAAFLSISAFIMWMVVNHTTHRERAASQLLRLAKEQSDRLFSASPVPTCITSRDDGTILDCNLAYLQLLGYRRDELVGRNGVQLGIAADPVHGEQLARGVRAGGQVQGVETVLRTKAGPTVHGLISAAPVEHGGSPAVLWTVVDDTARRSEAEALRAGGESYRELFQRGPLPMWIYDRRTLCFLAVNDAAVDHYGYRREEFLAMTIENLRPVGEVKAPRQFRREPPAPGSGDGQIAPHQRRDGTVIHAHVRSSDVVFNGRPARLVVAHNVTAELQAEDDLRASEAMFRAQFEATGQAQLSLDGRCLRVNGTFRDLLGYSNEELLQRGFRDIIHPADLAGQEAHRQRLISGETPSRTMETRFVKKDGGVLWANVTLSAICEPDPQYLVCVIDDITAQKEAEASIRSLNTQLEQRVSRLTALRRIDISISSSINLELILRVVLEQVTRQLEVPAAAVLVFQAEAASLEYVATRGLDAELLKQSRPSLGEGHAGRVVLERRRLHIPDLRRPPSDVATRPLPIAAGFRSYVGVPLIAKGQLRGVLEVFHQAALQPTGEWWDFLDTLADELAIAIDNATLFAGLQRSNQDLTLAYDTTLEGWSRALDLRDRETEGHTQRVTDLTVALARTMGVGEAQLIHYRRGALLHDIGKMGIPDQILLKPGPLDDEEWTVMRRHPVFARDLLSPISFLRPALDIPFCHHEKWDGSGYPRGLRADHIPLGARIFAVLDVWDALTSNRPYRPAWARDRALDHIRQCSGTHFEPAVVRSLEGLLQIKA